GALIDDDFKIDFSADTLLHMQRCRRSLAGMRTLVFTHQHSDHVLPSELQWVCLPYTHTIFEQPIALYGNKQVLALVAEHVTHLKPQQEYFELHRLEAFHTVITPDGDKILPL